MTNLTSDSETALRAQEHDCLALFRHAFSELELLACVALANTGCSRLSVLPSPDAASGCDFESVWDTLEEDGVVRPGTTRLLTGDWEFAFTTLAAARTRWGLLLGTRQWIEQTAFFASDALKNGELVIALPSDDSCRISFPASPEDAIDLALDHLDVKLLREQTGFQEQLTLAEYAVLLTSSGLDDSVLTAESLLTAREAPASFDAEVPASIWGEAAAPWPLELHNNSAAEALASLRRRALMYSPDGAHYGPLPDLVPLLRAFARMERYVAVDLEMEMGDGSFERSCFAVVLGDSSLWLIDFGRDIGDQPCVTVRSIGLTHVRVAMQALIDQSWRNR